MKKTILYALMAVAIASCGKENPEQESGTTGSKEDFVVTKIEYHLDDSAVIEPFLEHVDNFQVRNNSSEPVHVNSKVVYYSENKSSFTNDKEVSVPGEFFSSIPFVDTETNSLSLTVPDRHTWGEVTDLFDEMEYHVPVDIPPYSQVATSVNVKKIRIRVRYVAYLRGMTTGTEIIVNGIWEGINTVEVNVSYTQQDN